MARPGRARRRGKPLPKKPAIVVTKPRKKRVGGPTCLDLFSGAGGFAAGFRAAGWNVVAGNDVDAAAARTFCRNFPEATFFTGPISALTSEAILKETGLKKGQLDCLIGGPPCQSFSYNNHQRSASDVRARLFRKYLKLVEELKPKTLVMENVPGMLTIGEGAILDAIKKSLKKLGYELATRIMYAEDFGVPQKRRRVFIIGSRIGDPAHLFPNGTHGPAPKPEKGKNQYVHYWEPPKGVTLPDAVTVGEAITDLPHLSNGTGSLKRHYAKKAKTAFQRAARKGTRTLHNHICHQLTDEMLERIKKVPAGGNWRSIPFKLLPAGMQRAKESDHTKRYGRLHRSKLASTILTKCDPHWGAYVHPTQHRTITVREAARLQGFSDTFVFDGRHLSKLYEQVGNAVPPPLAEAIAGKVRARVELAAVAKRNQLVAKKTVAAKRLRKERREGR